MSNLTFLLCRHCVVHVWLFPGWAVCLLDVLDPSIRNRSCFQEKVELSNLVKKIQEISKMLALPVSDDNRDSFLADFQVPTLEHRNCRVMHQYTKKSSVEYNWSVSVKQKNNKCFLKYLYEIWNRFVLLLYSS